MIAKGMCALWTFTTSNRACGVFCGFITARKEMTSLWKIAQHRPQFATRSATTSQAISSRSTPFP